MDAYLQFQKDLHKICKNCGNRIAITYIKKNETLEELSYTHMEKKVLERAKTYESRGIRRGDRIAVLIPICPDAYLSILTLAYMGVTSVILDCNLHKEELGRLLEDADVSGIITTYFLFQTKMAAVGVAAFSESSQAKGWNHEEVKHPSDPDYEAIAILYSSGTTSNAKGVVIGYEQEMRAMDRLLEVVGTSDIRYLMMFPNSHVSGFTDALVLLLRGGTLATMEESSATQLVKGFQIYKPNTFGMVPKVWETFKGKIEEGIRAKGKTKARVIFGLISLCGKLRKATGINLGRKVFASINQEVFGGNLQNIHTGGGKAIPEVNEFFWNLGFDVYDFYASTEANIPIMVAKSVRKPLAGMGKPTALKGIDLRIQNPDTTGVGEIQVKSDTLMRGYFRNPELTLAAYEDGYFKTGDYGKLENGEIFITGRIKDSIYLKNGEKVSPDDIETMYRKYLPEEIDFSVAGVADDQGYSHVGVFVVGEKGQYDHLFRKINKQMSENYRFKELTYVESLPKTSVGKVKRYLLVKETGSKDGEIIRLGEKDSISKNRENIRKSDLEAILRKYIGDGDWDKDALLRENLGISSLELLQIVNEIMDVFGVDLTEHLGEIFTCKDLEEILYRQEASRPKEENVSSQKPLDLQAFPVKRTFMKNACFRFVMFFLKRNYRFSVVGLENLKKNQNYIICPNHQSHVDGYAVWAAMGKKRPKFNAIACFAKKEHLDNRFSRFFMEVVGGIPLDRYKNPVPAMKRAEEWMKDCQHFLLIHPEGTRTRDGKLGTFLDGAAYLSQKTQCPIIPVKIEGLYEIWPADRKRPRLRKKNFQKYEIVIRFGKPIDPRESTKEEITGRIREDIEGGTDFVENSFGKNEKSSGKDTFSLEILQEILLSQASTNMNTGDGAIENLTMNDRLAEDLGMDSLAFFGIVSEVESRYHVEIASELDGIKTIGDLFTLVENKLDAGVTDTKTRSQQAYPAPRSRWTLFQYKMWIRLMHVFYRIKIQGKENIPEEHVILCSNHFNYFDPFWLLAGLDLKKCNMNDFVCAVAQERFEEKQSRYYIHLLGGISVNRTGNAIPAMQRLIACASEGKSVILFPEGARSRDGGMLPIKSGVGKIALESGTNILPIRIDGGFEIWPRHKNLPSLFNWKRMKRHKLTVTYKPVISVEGKSEEEIMKQLIQAISK